LEGEDEMKAKVYYKYGTSRYSLGDIEIESMKDLFEKNLKKTVQDDLLKMISGNKEAYIRYEERRGLKINQNIVFEFSSIDRNSAKFAAGDEFYMTYVPAYDSLNPAKRIEKYKKITVGKIMVEMSYSPALRAHQTSSTRIIFKNKREGRFLMAQTLARDPEKESFVVKMMTVPSYDCGKLNRHQEELYGTVFISKDKRVARIEYERHSSRQSEGVSAEIKRLEKMLDGYREVSRALTPFDKIKYKRKVTELLPMSDDMRRSDTKRVAALFCSKHGLNVKLDASLVFEAYKVFKGDIESIKKFFKIFDDHREIAESDFASSKFSALIETLGMDRLFKVLEKMKGSEISFHDFISNLDSALETISMDPEDLLQRMMKIAGYSNTNTLTLLNYVCDDRIFDSANVEEALGKLKEIELSRMGIDINAKYPSFMSSKFLESEKDDRFEFTKDRYDIETIGTKTLCCFKRGGLAEGLLSPATYSPISGIIQGRIEKSTWFSFVWEIVEKAANGKGYDKSLVLDNLESNVYIGDSGYRILSDYLDRTDGYRKIYLGTSRNDISLPHKVTKSSKRKPYSLVGYRSEFSKYGSWDDSRDLYTVREFEKTGEEEITVRKMNKGDLVRCMYIQSLQNNPISQAYDNDSVMEILEGGALDYISYVVEDEKTIYGYIVTRLGPDMMVKVMGLYVSHSRGAFQQNMRMLEEIANLYKGMGVTEIEVPRENHPLARLARRFGMTAMTSKEKERRKALELKETEEGSEAIEIG
jgi:hypothetical protein